MIIHSNIAVLVTCHNRKTHTVNCLIALYNQIGIGRDYNLQVFLVDDGSTDGTSEAVIKQFPKVNVIQGNGNLYWNRGMHLAWETAATADNFDYYLWLNDDSFLFPNAIINLFKADSIFTSSVIVCGALCSVNEVFSYGLLTRDGQPVINNRKGEVGELMNGNVVLIPKDIFKEVGNLDIVFPHAIGDYDYGLRAIKKGFQIVTTENYVAKCDKNEKLPRWCYSNISIQERIKSLYSPLGNAHPYYFFLYEKRHFGFFTAVKHLLSIHLRLLRPQLWK